MPMTDKEKSYLAYFLNVNVKMNIMSSARNSSWVESELSDHQTSV